MIFVLFFATKLLTGSKYLLYMVALEYFFNLLTGTLPLFYYFFLYTVFVCKFRPQESQSDVLGDLLRMISLVVGSYFGMPPLLLPGLKPASPGTPTVLTRVRCLSLKPDMDREPHQVQSWELGLSRVLRPDDHRNHPELRHVSSLHYRLRHQSCPTFTFTFLRQFNNRKRFEPTGPHLLN